MKFPTYGFCILFIFHVVIQIQSKPTDTDMTLDDALANVENEAGDKRGWNNLSGMWGKRGWNNLSGMWGKRGSSWNDLSGMWGKRGWNNLSEILGKRSSGWNNLSGMWGKRGWNNLSGMWGKRSSKWNNLKGLWGKRAISPLDEERIAWDIVESDNFPSVNHQLLANILSED
ncbi:prothoracicostatic peptide-like [Limulus polyphemus]|uniref:Prothoracicostatic peptide-like n=1 Tax=Limulus polyphemus TaxID=6850 RepID=A0ABM1BM64_LIMPO|nr:prothoracicostatic peptide-like [Limulus polyphemus]XP_022253667.1 prothoracicostatic peptide-like [Limulus polyphemus]